METIGQIIDNLISHEISKHEAEKLLYDLIQKGMDGNMTEMRVTYTDEQNGIFHAKRKYNCPGIKGLKIGDKISVIKKP